MKFLVIFAVSIACYFLSSELELRSEFVLSCASATAQDIDPKRSLGDPYEKACNSIYPRYVVCKISKSESECFKDYQNIVTKKFK